VEVAQLRAHFRELADAVCLADGREDRLVIRSADDLDLSSIHQDLEARDILGFVLDQPVEQRPACVQSRLHARVPFERREKRVVRLLIQLVEHESVVADRLVLVEDEAEVDVCGHALIAGAGARYCAGLMAGKGLSSS
jgi:hypothetical protein